MLALIIDHPRADIPFDNGDPPAMEKEVTFPDGSFRSVTLMKYGEHQHPSTPPALLCSFADDAEEDLTTFVFDYDPGSATWRFAQSKTGGPREGSVAQRFSLGSYGRDQLSDTDLAEFARAFLADG